MMISPRFLLLSAVALSFALRAPAADDPKSVEFFESKIRPVLVEQCQKCHSEEAEKAKKLRGSLKLDSKANWQAGGDTGAAIVPGKPAEGTLVASLKYAGDLQMPPKGKLPDSVIADFEKWVKDGAVDPRTSVAVKAVPVGLDIERGRKFWSMQPPREAAVPESADRTVPIRTPVDGFIQAKWKELGLHPTAAADRRTLIRRVYFDLVGLPPTPEDVDAFERDKSPEAFAKVVDKLLASPQYGERWARRWLDVARYAEDQAHTFETKPKTNAYLYRDWVIAAFNKDMPYDRFVKLQIAGDLMPNPDGDLFTQLAGLGYLGLGANYYKNTAKEQAIAEELDDRVDTLTRGFLGLTVSCARCHDHKFDPIPTRDYYSIAGIYYGTNLTDAPLVKPEVLKVYTDAQKAIKDQAASIDQFVARAAAAAARQSLAQTSKYLVAARMVRDRKSAEVGKSAEVAWLGGLDPVLLDRWVRALTPNNTLVLPPIFKDWLTLKSYAKFEEVLAAAEALGRQLAKVEVPEALFANAKTKANAKAKLAMDPVIKGLFIDDSAPLKLTPAEIETRWLVDAERAKLAAMRAELERLQKGAPPAPLEAPVISGNGQGMKVYIRGNPMTKGEDAPKGFLQVLTSAPLPEEAKKKEFTRLELANCIADPANPLTARVYVNRVWQGHFGRGLVNTPSNFGALGERPSHPELLDYLAVEFVKHGWSTKWLHRQIVLSSTYQLSSEPNEADSKIDGANVYLWHMPRQRLDVESWRDSLLRVSGNLDETIGGPTFDLKDAGSRRRTVYAKISRHELNGLLRLFDFPDANVTADRRSVTTVPQQQLFALNSEFMINQAKAFAERIAKAGSTDEDRVAAAYRFAYGRSPETRELELSLRYLKLPAKPDDKLTRVQQYAQALLASNEFLYVD